MNLRKALFLLLFLALVVLAVFVIESFEPSEDDRPRANQDDVLELRLGSSEPGDPEAPGDN